jgi:hypothetical protein
MSASETREPNEAHLAAPKQRKISLDTWAVLFALAAAALIRSGVIKHIPW